MPATTPTTGSPQCVSLNTAVAASVGSHRVSYVPNVNGIPDPSGMQLRIDGNLVTLTPSGFNLAGGGRVAPSVVGQGIEVDFPDGTMMTAIPNFWTYTGLWYLNMDVFHAMGTEGLLGTREPGGWLPSLPSGTLGAMPPALHDRYVELNGTFTDAWRVTDASTLFDYAPGASTATFTTRGWPPESGPCVIPDQLNNPVPPLDQKTAVKACKAVKGDPANANCVADVMIAGNTDIAKVDLLSQQLRTGATRTTLVDNQQTTFAGDLATFSASVAPLGQGNGKMPTGQVQFTVNGENTGSPVNLDRQGNAVIQLFLQQQGVLEIQAQYLPAGGSVYLTSTSLQDAHTVQ